MAIFRTFRLDSIERQVGDIDCPSISPLISLTYVEKLTEK
jgi:hypothetical protein